MTEVMFRVIRLEELIHSIRNRVPGHVRDVSDNNLQKKTVVFINTDVTHQCLKCEAFTHSELLWTPTL